MSAACVRTLKTSKATMHAIHARRIVSYTSCMYSMHEINPFVSTFLSIKVHSSKLRIKGAVKLFQRKTITVNAIRLLHNNIHHRTMQDETQTHYGNCPDLHKYTRWAVVCKCTSLLTLRTKTAIVTYRPQAVLQAAKAICYSTY